MEHLAELNLLHKKSVLPLPKPESPRYSFEPSKGFSFLSFLIDRLNRDYITDRRRSLLVKVIRINFLGHNWEIFLAAEIL